MPSHMLKSDLAAGRKDAQQLAQRYQVSEQALWIQLSDLNLAERLHSDGY